MIKMTRINGQWVNYIPSEIAWEAYKEYAAEHGTDQSLDQMAEHGVFGVSEVIELLYKRIKRIETMSEKNTTDANEPILSAIEQQIRVKDDTIIRLAAEYGWYCHADKMSLDQMLAKVDERILNKQKPKET